MADPSDPKYRIDHSRDLLHKIQTLTEKVSRLEKAYRVKFLHAFKTVLHKLQTDPLGWGEPEITLPFEGLKIYHGVYSILNVYYTVIQERRTVVLRDVEVIPSFPLESESDENP